MTSENDRASLKQKLRDKLRALESQELATAIEHYEKFLQEAVLDDRESHDKDDVADARENADLVAAFDHPIQTHQAKVDAIEKLDFSVADHVRTGAVVSFNNRHFIVAVSTNRFECDGVTYMGISTQSPIFKALDGLKAGDDFTFNGREFTLDDVL